MDREDPGGGSVRLAGLLDKYGEKLLPDLKHYFGIDLRDIFSEVDPLAPDYVLAHVDNLPLESAFVAETRGGQEYRGWSEDRYIQAALLNSMRLLIYIFTLANIDPKAKKPQQPEPYPLPGNRERKPQEPKPGSFLAVASQMIQETREKKRRAAEWQAQQEAAASKSGASQLELFQT